MKINHNVLITNELKFYLNSLIYGFRELILADITIENL